MYNENNYNEENCTSMLKILITSTVASPNAEKFWFHITDSILKELSFSAINEIITHVPELQNKYPIAKIVQKELATSNDKLYLSQSGKLWLDVKRVVQYNCKPYILKTL